MKRWVQDILSVFAWTASAVAGIWLLLEIGSGFGVFDLATLGFWPFLCLGLFSGLIGVIITYIRSQKSNEAPMFTKRFPEIIDFKEAFKKVDWKDLIESSKNEIEIVVYYFDSWINHNDESLMAFISKPNTRIKVYVADPRIPEVFKNIKRLYPEHSETALREKISHTKERFQLLFKNVGASPDRFEFKYYPYVLNYSTILFDNKKAVLSFFDMAREQKVGSPAIVLDLEESKQLEKYVEVEMAAVRELSK